MLFALCLSVLSAVAQPKGQWDFDNGNLNAAVGTALAAKGTGTQFGTTTSFGLPNIGGQPANVMLFPAAADASSGYQATFTPVPNGGGTLVNEWTLIMDVLFPAASSGKLRALVETDLGTLGSLDADAFVRADNKLGTKGVGFGNIATNTWYRIGIVLDITSGTAGEVRFYIDGAQVGTVGVANLVDQRYALNGTLELFTDDDGDTQLGYVNSIQFRDVALSKGQMSALGAPTATGIPQTLPPVPSFIDKWIPSGQFASRTAPVGAVIDPGSTTIQDSSISLTLDTQALAGAVITRANGLITVQKDAGALTIGEHTLIVRLTDSVSGARSFTNKFTAALFYEDFEGITLGMRREEGNTVSEPLQWTNRPPAGWSVDNSQFKAVVITAENPDDDADGFADLDGRTEWAGWAFANKDFWIASDNQTRDQFALAQGTLAIADPNEWDDSAHLKGFFNSFLKTPPISLTGVAPNSVFLSFASSWRPEAQDDGSLNDLPTGFPVGPNGEQTNNQTGIITASFNGGTPVQVLKWDSVGGSPTFHPDSQNESILLQLNNPAGATNVVLTFSMVEAANDWWWAVDNIVVNAGASPPAIAQEPKLAAVTAGDKAAFSVTVTGQGPFTFQWFKGPSASKTAITGATNSVLNFAAPTVADAGFYSVEITGPGGKVSSADTRLVVVPPFAGAMTNQLVVHLKFDNSATDSSGRGNNGTAVVQPESTNGLPAYVSGGEQRVGTHALRILDGQHIGLGQPTDLSFGADTNFTIAFWAKGEANAWTSDPSFFGNKNWTSGGNPGLVFSAAGGGRFKLVWKASVNPRFDTPNIGSLNDTNWHHIAGTFDRQGLAMIYIDGQAATLFDIAGAGDIDAPLDYNIAQDGTGRYGFSNDTGAHFLKIWLDDFGIWRRALTPVEIKAIYGSGQSGQDLSLATAAPVILTQPAGKQLPQGTSYGLTVAVKSDLAVTYQWQKGGVNILGATSATLTLTDVTAANDGEYRVIVSNAVGSGTSAVAQITVTASANLKQDLVLHLKFDNDLTDASGRGNNGTAVGAPGFGAGKVGSGALTFTSKKDGSSFNYVTLGTPADLNFSSNVNFSVSFWAKLTNWAGDPSFIANKNWDSGNNRGWVIATAGDGHIQWNLGGTLAGANGDRKDFDGPAGTFSTNGNWRHIVVTFDRTGSGITYVDGVKLAQPNGASEIPIATPPNDLGTPTGQAVNIGQDGRGTYTDGGSVEAIGGMIDDMAVWRRTLSASEVTKVFTLGQAGEDVESNLITDDLVLHLAFDNDLTDASGRGNNGTAVGAPGFGAGKVGSGALTFTSKKDGSSFNYVTLGTPADLNFSSNVNFSVSFWAKLTNWAGDPSFIANKNWDSGNNRGWVIATAGDGHIQWNLGGTLAGANGDRKDFDGPAGTFSTNGNWRHIVVTFDRTGSGITYVDGVKLAQPNGASEIPIATPPNDLGTPTGQAVNIGQDGRGTYTDGGSVEAIGGMIDDVAVWRRGLSAGEVTKIYTKGQSGQSFVPGVTQEIEFTEVRVVGNAITMTWTGGEGPFLVQATADFSGSPWIDVVTTTERSTIQTFITSTGYFRIVDKTTKTVKQYRAVLTGASERPTPVNTSASGIASVSIDGDRVTYLVAYGGLSGPATAGHFHGPASASEAAGVIHPFAMVSPLGTAGIFGAIAAPLAANVKTAIETGKAYANIHTAINGGGEIRGQVLPAAFKATLSGAAERPTPVATTATGSGILTLIGNQLYYTITYSGLSSAASAGHIHGPATTEQAANVLIGFANVTGTSGTLTGVLTLDATQLTALLDGLTYVNIHTAINGGGEIRGQILPQ